MNETIRLLNSTQLNYVWDWSIALIGICSGMSEWMSATMIMYSPTKKKKNQFASSCCHAAGLDQFMRCDCRSPGMVTAEVELDELF